MPFVKGQSGNPGGCPKLLNDVQEKARGYSAENIERIADLAANARSEKVKLAACIALHEIAWGKPVQQQQHTGLDGGPVIVQWCTPKPDSGQS